MNGNANVPERQQPEYQTLDLTEFLQSLWNFKWMLFGLAAVMMLIAFVKVQYFTKNTYTASGVLYVSNKSELTSSIESEIDNNDILASRSATQTYIEILKMPTFLDEVCTKINETQIGEDGAEAHEFKWGELKGILSVASVNETELLRISVTTTNPKYSYVIMDSVLQLAPEKLTSVSRGGEVIVVDKVRFPEKPNDKRLAANLLLFAVIGLLIGVAFVFVRNLFDTKVHKSDDVAKRYGVSILGEIPQQ